MLRKRLWLCHFLWDMPDGTARFFLCEQAFCCSKGQSEKSPLTPGRKGQSFLYPQWLFRDYSFNQLLLYSGACVAPSVSKVDRVSPSCSLCSQYRFHDARQFICTLCGGHVRLNLGGNRFSDGLLKVVHGQLSARLGV
jgi:hypothetical protein